MKPFTRIFGKFSLAVAGCTLVLAFFLAAGQAAMGATPIKIGYVGGISGACGGLTHSVIKAMKIAIKEINDAGGVLGRPIQVIYRDSKTKPDEGAKQARDLILSEKVKILVGTCSSSIFMAINPISKQYKIPFFSALSGSHRPTIDFGHPYVFQTNPHTLMEGKALAVYAHKQGWKNIVTMGLDYEWGRMTVGVFVDELKKLDPSVRISKQLWPRFGESNYTSFITAALAEKPDAILTVFFGGHTNSLIKQGKAYGLLKRTTLLTFLSTESFISLGTQIPDGVHGWARAPFYFLKSPAAVSFVKKYRAANKGEYPNDWGILAYDEMYFIAEVIKRAGGTDPDKMRKAATSFTFNSLRGPLRMRAIDQTFNSPVFIGVTKKLDKYPFPVLVNIQVITDTHPSEATVRRLRAAAMK
ncbi:MAG: ABC transporter substrate-binding protein [SAR324 cluster bacterium]|nr:ABC transporter substrate-binding protein [SAR324 cluster bacterium]